MTHFVRLGAAVVLIAALQMGCSTVPSRGAPQQASTAPGERQLAGGGQPPGPSQAAPRPGIPQDFRVHTALSIRTTRAARVYTGRGPFFLVVAELPAGTDVEYLGSREGWLQVRTPDGGTGWLAAADAAIDDTLNRSVHYQIAPGRWEIRIESGLRIELNRVAAGVMRMVVSGAAAQPTLQEVGEHGLILAGPVAPGVQAALDIGESGIVRIAVSEKGILAELEGRPVYRSVPAEAGQVAVEFRPGLERIEPIATGWNLQVRGDLRPILRQEGSELVLDLPGALAPEGFAGVPAGIQFSAVDAEPPAAGSGGSTPGGGLPSLASPTATLPTRMPAGGLRLRLPARGTGFALYRAAPDRLELRFLPAGLAGKTIMLDPGHGGEEGGAEGAAGNLEKNVNLAVAVRLKSLLEKAGARVLITRTEDVRVLAPEPARTLRNASQRTQADLAARSALANQAGVDLFLSIHANGGPPGDGGTETYWAITNLNAYRSRHLAELIQTELVSALGLSDRGVKQRPFNVIRSSDAPGVLAELGFMTNAGEERLLISPEGQKAAAEGLLRAIRDFFGNS